MDHFQDIFHQAVNIKNSQLLSKRQIFESQPLFIKSGLYYLNKYENVRNQALPQKTYVFDILKSSGNHYFKAGDFNKAQHEYEQALSLFKYIKNRNKNWKNEGIIDEDLEYCDEKGNNSEEEKTISEMKLNIFLNLGLVYLKNRNYRNSRLCSEEALKINPENTKALFRHAKAYVLDINSDINEFKLAKCDLEKALLIDQKDEIIKEELCKINNEIAKLIEKEKNNSFKGIFNKNKNLKEEKINENKQILIKNEEEENEEKKEIAARDFWNRFSSDKNYENYNYDLSYEVNKNASVPSEIKELENFLETRGKDMVRIYEETGKYKEANNLKEKLKIATNAKNQLEKISGLDFDRPTSHLKEIAQKLNIDLKDPSIKNELIKIKNQNIKDLRKWLDGINQELPKNKKKSEKNYPSTKVENNYFINNNYYTRLVHNNNQFSSNYNILNNDKGCSECKENNKKKVYKNNNIVLKKKENSPESECGRLMNIIIIALFFILSIFTLIINYFSFE